MMIYLLVPYVFRKLSLLSLKLELGGCRMDWTGRHLSYLVFSTSIRSFCGLANGWTTEFSQDILAVK